METYSTKYISVNFWTGDSGWMWLMCEVAGWVRAFLAHEACRGFPLFFFLISESTSQQTRLEIWGFFVFCRNAREPSVKLHFLEDNQNAKLEICFVTFSVLLTLTFPTPFSLVRTGKHFVHKDRKPVIYWFFSLISVNVFHSFSFLP